MGRAAGATPTKKKDKEVASSAEDKAEELEGKRLRDLALSKGLLSRMRANPAHPLRPSKTILKCDGRDIVKKGHRKNKYLFAFPGLMAPVSSGKFGELTNLDSKNPVLYVDFPQGRLKLFGTIVYPKNKYLTLHFLRGAGSIVCEDCFESLVVFSVGWWIGSKEENPEELRLQWPKDLQQDKHADFDFTAGAGRATDPMKTAEQQSEKNEPKAPATQSKSKLESFQEPESDSSENEDSGEDAEAQTRSLPVRQSARTTAKKLNYADSSPEDEGDDGDSSDSSESQQDPKRRIRKGTQTPRETSNKIGSPVGKSSGALKGKSGVNVPILLDSDGDTPNKKPTGPMAAQRNLTSELETVTTKISEGLSTASSPYVATGNKVSTKILKQSKLEAFSQKPAQVEEGPIVVHEDSTPRKSRKASTSTALESSKKVAVKRPRKSPYKDKREDAGSATSEEDSFGEKVTPSKGKQKRIKNDKITAGNKGSGKRPRATQSKTNLSQVAGDSKSSDEDDGQVRQQKGRRGDKRKPAPTSKGKKSVGSKTLGGRSVKKGSESAEELSDSDEISEDSDDSDDDWVG